MQASNSVPYLKCVYKEVDLFPEENHVVWENLKSFDLVDTVTGSMPRLQTSVRVFWNHYAFYARFECVDDYTVANYTDRDDPLYSEDVVEIFISDTTKLDEYKEFEHSPRNVQFDAQIYNNLVDRIQVKKEWDAADWKTTVTTDERAQQRVYIWELPFKNFERGTPSEDDRWLMNFYRIDRGASKEQDEYTAWSPPAIVNFHKPRSFGTVIFVK